MKIAIIGASGNVGSRVTTELLARGHGVTAIARNVERIAASSQVTPVVGDAGAPETLAPILAGHDAVVSSVGFTGSDPARLIAAVRQSGVRRYLVVGGAGSLFVAPGLRLVDAPNFPAEYKTEALAGAAFLEALRGVEDLDWTYISPPAWFAPGARTGKFRLGKDDLLSDADGKSWLSMEDFAIALADELERPANIRGRFTVGY
jgi:putative NADH-flavin reductase